MIRTFQVSVLLVAFLASGAVEGAAVKLSGIPSPRPNGWVTDLTGRLSPGALENLNRLGDEVKARTRGEIAVAVVDDIDDVNTRGFATRLFNRWGIGRRGIDDGVLIFVSLDDRRAEIILGSGIDDPQRRRASEEIMQSEMVPRFRQGDPAGALLAGAQECAQRLLGVPRAAAATLSTAQPTAAEPVMILPPREEPAAPGQLPPAPVSSVVTGLLAIVIAFGFFLHFTRRAPTPWPDRSHPVRSAREDALAASASASAIFAADAHAAHASSSSDAGFGGGHSDGGGAGGHW